MWKYALLYNFDGGGSTSKKMVVGGHGCDSDRSKQGNRVCSHEEDGGVGSESDINGQRQGKGWQGC